MSEEMFNSEKDYGITMAIAKSMLDKGLISLANTTNLKKKCLENINLN